MCKIEEVRGFQIFGKLHNTRAAAIDAGLTEVASQLQRNHVNNIKEGLLRNRDELLYLLGQHAQECPDSSEPEKDPAPASDLDWTESGHARACSARATGKIADCNCGILRRD